jgi:hypothetical protein
MAKEKIDVVIDNVTYKNIDVTDWRGAKDYTITTSGIAQIIKQFVKNNFGDIKVWAKSDSFAGGSSVDVYLWKVPEDWYDKVNDFAERFGMYNQYDGGDGIWRGKKIGATTTDGKSVDNYSPYMHVKNSPPYGSKEYDMPPPNYNEKPTPKKKEYQRKGGKYSPTDNLDLVLDCGNGWKIYVGKPKEKYLYNVVKDGDTQPNREQWAEIKADMLEAGFMWGYKSGTFQRWTTMPDDTLPQQACNVLSKYWGGASQPKAENPKQPQVMIPQGTEFELMEDDGTLKKGDKGVFADDYYPPNTFTMAYMNSEARPDIVYEIPLKKIRIIEEAPREETPEEEILPFVRGETIKLKMPFTYNNSTYPEGLRGEIKRVDYVFKTAYVYFYGDDSGNYPVPFEYLEKFVDTDETPKEVNLDEYIKDLNVLLEMEDDESKRLELATYISDLNILKLLD